MFVLVIYVPDEIINGEVRKSVINVAQDALCEGFHVNREDVKIILECVKKENCNAKVGDVFFPILYMPKETPYEAKKLAGALLYERLLKLFPDQEMKNVYLHMKEHELNNYAYNGKLAYFDSGLKNKILEMQKNSAEGK